MLYPELGRLIERMVKSLHARSDSTMAGTMTRLADRLGVTVAAIQKWRQGKHKPAPEILAQLVKIGVAEAGLDRAWAERVLFLGEHPERMTILDELFGKPASGIRHNLPRRPFIRLVGREREVAQIIELLMPESRHWLAPIEGVGGVGKSALALEVGWRIVEGYLQLPAGRRFDAIIWVSAKREALTAQGIETQRQGFTNLDDIYRAIADVLEWPGILRVSDERRPAEVDRALRDGRILLILDNLETVEDPHVLRFLRDLPPPTKSIATMRFHEDMPYPIRLKKLDEEAARQLVLQECEARGITLDTGAMSRLLTYTRGIPLAIWWAVGLLAMEGYTIEATLDRLADPTGDLQRFIFEETLARLRLRWPEALEVLLALTFFDLDSGATTEALAATTGLALPAVEQAQQRLLNLNLISRHQSSRRFTMLPLTRDFAQQELRPEWEVVARQCWCEYFLQFAARNIVREKPKERYWNSLGGGGLTPIDPEWPNLRNLLAWADYNEEHQILIEMMMLLVHYMELRALYFDRSHYARKAADAANKLGQKTDEALLRIDGLGWLLTQQGRFADAEQEITIGLQIIQGFGTENIDVKDSTALAYAFLARVHLQQGNIAEATELLNKAISIIDDCRFVVQRRVVTTAAEFAYQQQDYQAAIKFYKDAIHLEQQYGGEDPISCELHQGLGFAYLALGEVAQAEAEFEGLLALEQGILYTIGVIYGKYGLACVARSKGEIDKAVQLAQEALETISRLHIDLKLQKEIEDFLSNLKAG